MAVVASIATAAVLTAGATAVGAVQAGKAEKRARNKKDRLTGELDALENNRQDVINPYEGVTDLGSMVSDLSAIASNPFANLSVSTAAAEMQIEEADIALANTLDTLRATGASAGGATALARMALESKKGVAASIEQQEANNQKLAAKGEAQRLEDKKVQGEIYEFETQEGRDEQQMARKQAQITGAAQQQAAATQAKAQVISAGIGGLTNMASAGIASDRKLKKNINKIGESKSGINIYEFEYLHNDVKFQGVMADEVPQASIEHEDGYSMVDYSLIDVEFKEL
jgi:hypothetical protein